MGGGWRLGRLVHLDKHPVHLAGYALRCRASLEIDGAVLLPGFLRGEALEDMASAARRLASQAHFCDTAHDVWLRRPAAQRPHGATDADGGRGSDRVACGADGGAGGGADAAGSPVGRTVVGSIAYDLLSPNGALASLHRSRRFVSFLSRVCAAAAPGGLHPLADPLGACSVNVFRPGQGHFWHFDEAPFSTTLMLQPATAGGRFEVVPDASGPRLDAALAELAQQQQQQQHRKGDFLQHAGPHTAGKAESVAVANHNDNANDNDNDASLSGAVDLGFEEPGTLSIFAGARSLHRVSVNRGDRDRLVAVMCYSEEEGRVNSPEVRLMFWGRDG